jgi:hypothetical protein
MIRTFEEFWNCIDEAFNNPVEIKWIDKGIEYIGLFIVNNKVYNILCKDLGENIWTFKFYHYIDNKLSPELTKDYKNSFRVLPTIKNGFINFIENKNPDGIIFGALDSSVGRKKLYTSFSLDISKSYNYLYNTRSLDNKQIFILYKPNIDNQILFDKITQIVESEI